MPSTKRVAAPHDAHVRAHDDLLIQVTTSARSAAEFIGYCTGGYRPSVYPDLGGTRLADVLDAAFADAGRKTRCWRGTPRKTDLDQVDAWIEAEIRARATPRPVGAHRSAQVSP